MTNRQYVLIYSVLLFMKIGASVNLLPTFVYDK
jgi:hypothetical protein